MPEPTAAAPTRSFADISQAAQVAINEATQGVAMKKLTLQRKSSRSEFKHSGHDVPATVINFNPICLTLHDGNVPWTIPDIYDKSKKGIEVKHADKVYVGSYFTVREPRFVAWPTDVKKPAADDENATAEYKPVWISQLERADQYRREYTDPSRNMMGGVLVFEGDIHAFTKNKGTIRIPKFEKLEDGRVTYFSEEVDALKELSASLAMQKDYCMFMIQQGDEYNQDDQQRKNITPVHRKWDKYALDMNWKEIPASWTSAVFGSEESCKGCGKGRVRSDAFFCVCGRPYNAFAAFMAGENVPEAYIMALKGDELDKAITEMDRRAKIRAKFQPKA